MRSNTESGNWLKQSNTCWFMCLRRRLTHVTTLQETSVSSWNAKSASQYILESSGYWKKSLPGRIAGSSSLWGSQIFRGDQPTYDYVSQSVVVNRDVMTAYGSIVDHTWTTDPNGSRPSPAVTQTKMSLVLFQYLFLFSDDVSLCDLTIFTGYLVTSGCGMP